VKACQPSFKVDRSRSNGVKIVSYQEPWTEAPGDLVGDILFAIAAWVANQESKRRSERTKAGLLRAKTQGKASEPGTKAGESEGGDGGPEQE